MGKCHGITFVRWIVKHLVSYMAAAQQDNRLISWLSEPYRTISHFLTLIPFSPDIRLRLIHTFTVHSVNTYPVDTHRKKHHFCTLSFLSSTERTRNNRPIPHISNSIFSTARHCRKGHNNNLLCIRYHLKDNMSCSCDLVQIIMSIHLKLIYYGERCQNRLSTWIYWSWNTVSCCIGTHFFNSFSVYIFYPATIKNSVAATHTLKLGHFCHC